MELSFLSQWLTNPYINAIFWTLVHSLWVGIIMAVIAGIIIASTRHSKAIVRYRLFCSLLVLFVVSMCCIALFKFVENPTIQATKGFEGSASVSLQAGNHQGVTSPSSFIARSISFLNQNASWLFGVWMIFFIYKSMKLIVGIFYIHRIRTFRIKALGEEWISKVQEFAGRMGITQQVAIIQSALVKVPVTLGFLKPVIVVPIGLVLQLPAEQVETIIWHELAHIYRRDYLVNILQRMVEAVFFFNPAVFWLSALIAEEREACCDDIVLANVNQKSSYLAALVAFHSGTQHAPSLAMGLSLRPNQLMHRLRRMVHQENKRLSFVELSVLAIGMLMLSAFSYIPQVKPGIKSGVVYIKKALSENLLTKVDEDDEVQEAPVIKLAVKQNKANMEAQLTDTLIKFKSILFKNSNEDKANRDVNVIDGQDNRYHIVVANGIITLVTFNEKAIDPSQFGNYERVLAQIDQLMKQKLTNPSPQYDNGYKAEKRTLNFKLAGTQWDKKKNADSTKLLLGKMVDDKEKLLLKHSSIGVQVNKKMPVMKPSDDRSRVLGVITALIDHKVVPNFNSVLWFALTDEQLVVNDQRQSDELHQKFKMKFGIKEKYGLFYGPTKVHGTGIIFEKTDL